MRHHRLLSIVFVVLILAGFAVHTNAQTPACPDIVKQALALTSAKCSQIGRNQACFGNPIIMAEAKPNLPDPSKFVFAAPGDTVNLSDLQSLQMGEMNTQDQTWGVAYMRSQANLPDTAAGQYVTMLLFGNVQITDKSQDSKGTQKPMQAFYFRTGVGASACQNIPTSGLVLQSPKGKQKVELTVNEVHMKIGSTVYLEAPDDTLNSLTQNDLNATQGATQNATTPPTLTNTPSDQATGAATDTGPNHSFTITTIQGSVDITYNGHTETINTGQQSTVTLGSDGKPIGTPEPPKNVNDLPPQNQTQFNLINDVVNQNLIDQPPTDEANGNPTATTVPPTATTAPVLLLPTDTLTAVPPTATNLPPTNTLPPPPPPPPPPTNTPKPTFTPTPTPSTIATNSGSPQAATVNTAFAPFSVIVKGAGNVPISGVSVTFTAPSSGASGTFPGAALSVAVLTDASGIATAPTFTANTTAGSYNVIANIGSLTTPISLTNTPGAASSITVNGGSGQSATVHTAFATALSALVKDVFNNPVSGASVTFAAPGGGASGVFSASATVTTDGSGIATAPTFTANGTAGLYTVSASTTGVATTADYSLTNTAGAANSITANGGSGQSATVHTAFATALTALVKDADGNPVPGVSVTFVPPAGGATGTFGSSATVTTDGSGIATAPTFTANGTAGSYVVAASAAGVGTPDSYSLTNTPGAASSITATAGSGQNTTVGTAFGTALQATVKDADGNPIPGASVTFAAPGSGASGVFSASATVTTDGSGIATAPTFTANNTAGTYNVTASTAGVGTNATFNLTNKAGVPNSIAVNGGSPQSKQEGTAFAALSAIVKDSFNNVVSGATVTFTAPASGASGTFPGSVTTANAATNGSGIATAPTFTANGTLGSYTVSASVSGVGTTADFSLTNTVGAPASITVNGGSGQTAEAGTNFTTALSATVKDSGGNPVPSVTVTFTSPANANFAGSGTTTASTNGSGIATASALTATCPTGAFNVTASVSGVGTSASFGETSSAPTVSNTADSGAGSLRQAVANSCAGSTITVSTGGTITLTGGEIAINKSLTINGSGTLTISGNNANRVFNISAGPVTLSNMTITNGNATAGGGVNTSATLTVNSVAFNNNATTTNSGGGINATAALTVTNSTFTSNSSAFGGGGITSSVSANVTGSTFTSNTALGGAGIYTTSGSLTVTNSTFTTNVSNPDAGGAIQTNGTSTVTTSTFNNNTGHNGGAISNRTGSMTINGGTFTNNTVYALENQTGNGATMSITGSPTCSGNSPANISGATGTASCP